MKVRLALTGFGNVGQGVATLLERHGEEYEARYGARLLLAGIRDRGGARIDPDGLDPGDALEAKRRSGTVAEEGGGHLEAVTFLRDARADVLLETASTNFEDAEPGWSYIRAALANGADVVLASKGALALYYEELMAEAARYGRRVLFSATVGAPLPSLQVAERALNTTVVRSYEGIVNGTTNQILTLMGEGASYEEGVRKAQEIGIAETDPTLDVDGWDAAAKAVILANALLGGRLRLRDVARQGIRGVSQRDLQAAAADGDTIKLIARGRRTEAGVQATVGPERRSLRDSLGRLRNDEMGIVLKADYLGDLAMTTGESQYPGGVTTALTVLRDVLNLVEERGWGEE